MARSGDVRQLIAAAWEESGLSKGEVAFRLYGDRKKWREWSRYMKPDGPLPRASAAVALAGVLKQKPDAFLVASPLEEVATELHEANRLVESLDSRLAEVARETTVGFAALRKAVAKLDRRLDELAQRLPDVDQTVPPRARSQGEGGQESDRP